jgi:hypothetical protein
MNRFFSLGLIAIVASLGTTGCAAQAQCLRDNEELSARVDQQEHQLRDVNGHLTAVSAEKATGNLADLAKDGWTAALGMVGWVSNETPIAYRGARHAYTDASDRVTKARKCYEDNGGAEAHSYEEYKNIATKCLNDN